MTAVGGKAMQKNEQKTQLLDLLTTGDAIHYLKSLSPSGVELEIMTLDNFDLQNPEDSKVSNPCVFKGSVDR